MLRLINSDPNVKVKIIRHRAGGKVFEDQLDYDFPIGDVIETFSFEIPNPVSGADLRSISIDGIVCRASLEGGLPAKQTQEQRANGLLIVDEDDSVLDLTLLPDFNNAPYLSNIFGLIRLRNVRAVFSWYLNNGKDSPLTTSRDGFDARHEFTKLLFRELGKRLIPVYKREEQRFSKPEGEPLSAEAKKKIDEAIKELNRLLLKQISGEGEGEQPEPTKLDPSAPLQFVPSATRLIVGTPRVARLYLQSDKAALNGAVIYDSSNALVSVTPQSTRIRDGKKADGHLMFGVTVRCDQAHEQAKITALADGHKEAYEAHLQITDVTTGTVFVPPVEMEFRPKESRGQPNRANTALLYINSTVVPVGRKIRFTLEVSHGAIALLEDTQRTDQMSVVFDSSHLLPSSAGTGRVSISWRGSGWGQSARLVAETKRPDGTRSQAFGILVLEQPEETGG
jgi:hypothetical protein